MRQDTQYLKILDGAFSKHFPAWAEMSPYDPVKLFAEGVASSLGSVEARQRRIVDTILDSLPALFSVKRSPMRLPVGLFHFIPSPRLSEALPLDTNFRLRFQSSVDTVTLFPRSEFRLSPITEFTESVEGDNCTLTFHHEGPSAELQVQFFPTENASPGRLITLECKVARDGKDETFSSADLRIENETENFTRYGTIKLRRVDKAPLVTDRGDITVKLRFEKPVAGNFFANLFPFGLGLELENVDIGHLKGEPWEEISLPETLLDAPEVLILHYPNGTQLKLFCLDEDILKVREHTPERFRNSFFYHGTHHRIVIPDADMLMHEFNGGVAVTIPKAVFAPASDWLTEEYQPILGERASVLDEVLPFRPFLPLVEREKAENYLARFYSQWRQFPSAEARPRDLFLEELESSILTNEPSLRAVEIECDAETGKLTAFCLAENPVSPHAASLSQEKADKLRNQLSQLVPLSYHYAVAPFYRSALKLNFVVSLEVAESRLKLLGEEALNVALRSAAEALLLPTPFGKSVAGRKLDKADFLSELRTHLEKNLVEPGELRTLEVAITNEEGAFLTQLVRNPGQCFGLDITVKPSYTSYLLRNTVKHA